ncbi:thioredoxin family protein [Vallitaleaceae bacterium 9-2]
MQEIREVDTLKTMVDTNAMTVVVFTMPSCGVCTPLKQKIASVLEAFPEVARGSVDLLEVEAAKGEYQIYTAPIIVLFVQGKEAKRYSSAMNIVEFKETIARYQQLMG